MLLTHAIAPNNQSANVNRSPFCRQVSTLILYRNDFDQLPLMLWANMYLADDLRVSEPMGHVIRTRRRQHLNEFGNTVIFIPVQLLGFGEFSSTDEYRRIAMDEQPESLTRFGHMLRGFEPESHYFSRFYRDISVFWETQVCLLKAVLIVEQVSDVLSSERQNG